MSKDNPRVLKAGLTALLPALAMATSALAAPPLPTQLFVPPTTAMLLTRTFHRPLIDGKEIVTRRSYKVHITPDGNRFRVDGELVDSMVDAPPSLHMLAEIERTRPDSGMFPFWLDAQGQIVEGNATHDKRPGRSLADAANLAAQMIGMSPLGTVDKQQAQQFLRQLQTQATGTAWPADLFHHATGARQETRRFALTDGGEGSVTISIEARAPQGNSSAQSLERVVVTDLAGDQRTTREQWTIASLGG